MWKAIPLVYRIGIVAAVSVALIWGLWYAKEKYDSSIRETERTACNAEYAIKENERQSAIDKANQDARKSKAKNTQKSKTMAPSAVIDELTANGWMRGY